MAQWVKVLATKPGFLSSVPSTHVVGENQLFYVLLLTFACLLPVNNKQTNGF